MKPTFEDVKSRKGSASLLVYRLRVKAFPFKWHYHPEFELTLILKGNGKRMVGDSYQTFSRDDLVLIGPGLPHTWVSESARNDKAEAVVIQFDKDAVSGIIHLPEFVSVKRMLDRSVRGLSFTAAKTSLREAITKLPSRKGADQVTGLLQVLHHLSDQPTQVLSSAGFAPATGSTDEKRINKVCQHLERHFTRPMPLREVAGLIHLSESAFCKFFKRTTGKTFSDYVNELRIGRACRLLTETDRMMSAVAADAGFESLTYFNRIFKRKMGCRPLQYRRTHPEK